MKAGIHPQYEKALITCACGRVTETRSTVGELHVEICSHCHPFFTGRQKLVDTAGRVERFMAKYGMEGEGDPGRTAKAPESPAAQEAEPTAADAERAQAASAEVASAHAGETEPATSHPDADGPEGAEEIDEETGAAIDA